MYKRNMISNGKTINKLIIFFSLSENDLFKQK